MHCVPVLSRLSVNFMHYVSVLSDSDSDWSSSERRQKSTTDVYSKVNRKPTSHKRVRKKRTAIPVATPRVPTLPSAPNAHQQQRENNTDANVNRRL
jgi:hypothetical protein